MKKIGITGSLASGKTTASKILSSSNGPLFSADHEVKKLYKQKNFRKLLKKKFNIKNINTVKSSLKKLIQRDKSNIKKLEKIIHPLVRKKMFKFMQKFKNKKFVFFEIPLMIGSNLMSKFDIIFFIKAKRTIRLRRFILKGGDKKIFNILDKKQFSVVKKIKYCDHIIVNEKKIKILKKNLLDIFNKYV